MPIDRYGDVEWFMVQTSQDEVPRAFHERIVPARESDFRTGSSDSVLVTDKDTMDLLAYQHVGDSRYWKTIGEINWPLVEDPLECPNNVNIIIPSPDQIL